MDWEGWKRVTIPKHYFRVSRQPRGWGQIDHITIAAGGWGLTAPDGLEIHLDEMVLTRGASDDLTVSDFETDADGWLGVTRSKEQAHTGEYSARWSDLSETPFIRTTLLLHDWTEWGGLEFWLHAQNANGQRLVLLLYSNDPITEKVDSYNFWLVVDWTGWKRFSLRKKDFYTVRQPVGWHQIDNLTIGGGGWGLEPKPDTVLHLDDVSMRRAEPEAGPEESDVEENGEADADAAGVSVEGDGDAVAETVAEEE